MNTRALAVIAVVATLGLGGAGIFAQAVRPGDTQQLWEYRTEVMRVETRREAGTPDQMLNSLGHQGWELVAMTRREVRIEDTLQTETVYTFKRMNRAVSR
jgi:hypothetical protein